MNDVPTSVEHLGKLARDYRDTYLALQTRYREIKSAEEFFAELKQREEALLNRFRLVQQQLLSSLKEEELERMLEICSIFDEIRIINQFAIQTLAEADESLDNQVED
jgi:hypothetical protein